MVKMEGKNICSLILACFLPPVSVFLVAGCGTQLCINILLCLLGYVPGIVHVSTELHSCSQGFRAVMFQSILAACWLHMLASIGWKSCGADCAPAAARQTCACMQ